MEEWKHSNVTHGEPSFLNLLLFFLLMSVSCVPTFVASTFISDNVLESHASTARNLLQAKTACPVNFEFLNYTILTSQCKGPNYPPDRCCGAFKELACPYADELNDLSNDCATTMFSYINLNGKYPPGLFANECREGQEGLACPASSPSESLNANGSQITQEPSLLLVLATAFFLVLLCQSF